jgi:N-hydroxyarylamine O-acetyltransferase
MDLAAYLARVGLPSPRPSLDDLVWAHVTHIPFENVDVQLGRPIRIDLPSVADKLVHRRRGGYCFEQNTLMAAVLRALGHEVTPMAARVRWGATGPTPRSHMILRTGEHLVDVGFGGFVPPAPLRLVDGLEQRTPLGVYRFVREDGFRVLQARAGAMDFADVYAFTEEPHGPVDYEVMNHFTSTHPESRFVKNLIVSRPSAAGRRNLVNDELIVRGLDGEVEKTRVAARDIPAILRRDFGVDVPDGTTFPALR